MTKLEKFFVDADVDNSGQLTHHELAEALRKAGYKGSDEQILVCVTCNLCQSGLRVFYCLDCLVESKGFAQR